jgi:transcription termination factor Rho
VECGHDVVILLDSITRLARAIIRYNRHQVKYWGVDSNALQKPNDSLEPPVMLKMVGLSIIATALTETGSKWMK